MFPCSCTPVEGNAAERARRRRRTLPRLVSIYSGFPRFPRLCRARSAPPVCIILYLFRLVTSCTGHPTPFPWQPFLRTGVRSFSRRVSARMASYTRARNGLYGLQGNPSSCCCPSCLTMPVFSPPFFASDREPSFILSRVREGTICFEREPGFSFSTVIPSCVTRVPLKKLSGLFAK